RISEGQPCDISGIDGHREIDEEGGVQWPCPSHSKKPVAKQRRLFEDGKFFTPDQKARFIVDEVTADPEPPCDTFPLRLLTGRGSSAQWHTQTRTGKSAVLRKLGPKENHVEIHPSDAEMLGIESGESISVTSRRGEISVRAFVTSGVPVGSVFIPMHEETTNHLTLAVFDPHSHQPSYKSCAVRISPG
ncbi:MAG: molybdopterin oxidoreductase family protein, partial [Verrucomicrobiota bacterium]